MAAFRAGVLAGAALLSLLAPPRAQAVEARYVTADVRFAPPACPIAPLSIPAFVEALRVELTSRGATPGATLVSLSVEPCDTSTTHVQVSVNDAASGRGSARDIDLADVTFDARPRALALAVAELVRGALPPASPLVPPPAPAPPPAADVVASPTLVAIDAHALLDLYPARDTHLWGGRVSVSGVGGRWQHGGFADLASGERSFAQGRIELLSLGGGAFIGARWTWRHVALSPGVAASAAWSRAQGHASAPGVVAGTGSAATAAVRARLQASLLVGRALSLSALFEAGYVVRAFDATIDGVPATGLSGAALVFGLGLGFGP
jgi:hypothetical protein